MMIVCGERAGAREIGGSGGVERSWGRIEGAGRIHSGSGASFGHRGAKRQKRIWCRMIVGEFGCEVTS